MTTFITSIFNLNPNDTRRSVYDRIQCFEDIVKYGINISIVCCPYYEPLLQPLLQKYNNIKIIEVMKLSDTMIYKICEEYEKKHEPLQLPSNRTIIKDTREYMILMNSKIEFIKKAIEYNVWNSDYFCWIDFSIKYIINDEKVSRQNILNLSKYKMPLHHSTNIIIPGCSEPKNTVQFNQIDWRFCGGVLYGYKVDLIDFYDMYCIYFKQYIENYHTLIWETNVWAWMEFMELFQPVWRYGNHDDSIFMLIDKSPDF
jgi:hypothetical protein